MIDIDFTSVGLGTDLMVHIEGSLGFVYDPHHKTLHIRLMPNLHVEAAGGHRKAISAKPDHSTKRNRAWCTRQKNKLIKNAQRADGVIGDKDVTIMDAQRADGVIGDKDAT